MIPGSKEAAQRAGGFWITRSQPPMLGGMSDRFDVVVSMSGLPDFAAEYAGATELELEGTRLRVLPLARILASKRAANRPEGPAAMVALEVALKVLERVKEVPPRRAGHGTRKGVSMHPTVPSRWSAPGPAVGAHAVQSS